MSEALRLSVESDALADEREMIHLCSWVHIRNLLHADAAELHRLHAENEALKADAERYRWLRDVGDETWTPFCKRTGYSAEQLDTAIDARMKDLAA